jgi:hypothetical protein
MSPVTSSLRVKIEQGSNGFLGRIVFQTNVKGQLTIFISQKTKDGGRSPRPIPFKGEKHTNEFSIGAIPHESMEGEIAVGGLDESSMGVFTNETVNYNKPSPKRGIGGERVAGIVEWQPMLLGVTPDKGQVGTK